MSEPALATDRRNLFAPTLSLFVSSGTLVCCALPALFVTLGMGAALAGLTANFPQLVWLSEYKEWIFAGAGLMLLAAGVMQWRARNLPCPVDPVQARACLRLRRISLGIYIFAVAVYLTGAFFAFAAVYVLL
ncbi:MAG: hypothetical protein V2J26_05220 [Pacificimonas sp.]|jgi:hypothetical protein|nr:hypothetical protein [Pacificimonas sp.]